VDHCAGRTEQARRFAQAAQGYQYDAITLTATGRQELPETGDLSDLAGIGKAAAALLVALSPAADAAGQALNQARDRLTRLAAALDKTHDDTAVAKPTPATPPPQPRPSPSRLRPPTSSRSLRRRSPKTPSRPGISSNCAPSAKR